ncbi:putative invertase inhibitor [Humulus lupulus]|uniref:putative invertase inhibitor n=1 Tax=Humulus lupulus TaxID=3486 RepID=UPI002B411306|nr:putative invertase inhibitor [Humulus lupulus]
MEYYLNTFFLLFLVTILLSNPPQPTIAADNNEPETGIRGEKLIPTACRHAVKKGFCNAMLQSDPYAHDADLHGFGLIALRQAASNASDLSEYVKTLLNDPKLNPEVQDGAAECLEMYLDAAEQLDDSVAALEAKAYKDINTWVNVAVTDSKSCDDALTGHESVLGEKNEVFRWLCENALAINKVLVEGKN